jgi:hypothetical protein
MHPLRHVLTALALVIICTLSAQAQIPNATFESWTNSTTPASWLPNNNILWTTVTRSSTAYSGSFAAQGQVVSYGGSPISPTLTSMIFPVSQHYTILSGFYRFTPVGGDQVAAAVYMFKNSSLVGLGAGQDGTAYGTFTQVDIPIDYTDSLVVPDSAYIQILVTPATDSSDVHVGSTFIADELSFGGVTRVTELPGLPKEFRLEQNFPNPFNPTTRIAFSLPKESHLLLKIYNIAGEEVATLADEVRPAGNYAVDVNASHLTSGVYFYKLVAGSFIQTNKMILMK